MDTIHSVLIVEDDPLLRDMFRTLFESEGFTTHYSATVSTAFHLIETERLDLALVDYWLPDGKGSDVVLRLRKRQPSAQAIVVSGFGSDQLVIESLRDGAFAFIHKPFDTEALMEMAWRAIDLCRISRENETLQSAMQAYDEKFAVQERELSGLSRIATLAEKQDNFDEYEGEALSVVGEALGDGAALLYYKNPPSNGRLILRHHRGLSEEEGKLLAQLDCSEGLVGQVEVERKLIAAEDLRVLPIGHDAEDGRPVELGDLKKAIACPILSKGQLLGVLLAGFRQEEPIDELKKSMMLSLGRQFGIAVKNAFLSKRTAVDGLTNLYNRGYFDNRYRQEFNRCKRHGREMTLMRADVDGFRNINDTYGQQFGDKVLRSISQCLRSNVRISDFAARYGEEELAVVFPETGLEGGRMVAEKISRSVQELRIRLRHAKETPSVRVGISIGLATFPSQGDTPENLLREADGALYRAKAEGGNRVVCS